MQETMGPTFTEDPSNECKNSLNVTYFEIGVQVITVHTD